MAATAYMGGLHLSGESKEPVQQSEGEFVLEQAERQGSKAGRWMLLSG